ncbi:MAG: NfeD family protein [Oscillospiraceae bacterium]|nr:NfeD family protein [Oscillospiraceae bacterium]
MNWIPSVIWLGLLILFAAAEAATVALVSVWFAAGALVALLATIVTDNIWTQILLFVLVSAITMAVVRPLARKYVFPHRVPTNADRVIGREGVITQAVDNLSSAGVVVVAGMAWTARSDSGAAIPEGTVVTVKRIEGVKLYVAPAQERKE